jgi:cobalt-zinc-cadmium efflux system outer membrane protein
MIPVVTEVTGSNEERGMPEHPTTLSNGTGPTRSKLRRRLLPLVGLFLSTGCLYHAREAADANVREIAARPFDLLPDQLRDKTGGGSNKSGTDPGKMTPPGDARKQQPVAPGVPTDVQTTAFMAAQDKQPALTYQLTVPGAVPGAETPPIVMPADPAGRLEALRKLYTPLAPLPEEVKPLPGPNGQPYTLTDFQRIAAENSPTLRQAAFDVQTAKGNMIQAATYANPTVSIQEQASNNNSLGGAVGFSVDQVITTFGKQRLATAAAKKALDNAELALKRSRSDLSTAVRNAYYALLVARETMRVTRAMSVLTDEVYRVQLGYTERGGLAASYEPAALRAQAYAARLAYIQAIATYQYSWKQLVATIGVRQLPISEVAGRIDAVIPYYDFDQVLAQTLNTHTDVLTARNGIPLNNYNLKLARITPYPNFDVNVGMFKDRALFPIGTYHTFSLSAPVAIWDQNRGNILAAEGAVGRALEEPHRVEMVITNGLASAYTNYRTNLDAVEYYRRYILPDQVRAYRGVLLRRQVDINAQFGDLVTAQQALATSVTTYLGLLGTLWSSVISVADYLQTDDLFQTSTPIPLPGLPDLEHLPALPCCHPYGETAATCAPKPVPGPVLAPGPLPVPVPGPVAPMPAPAPLAPKMLPPTVPGVTIPIAPVMSAPAAGVTIPMAPIPPGPIPPTAVPPAAVPTRPLPPVTVPPLPNSAPAGPRVPLSGPATGSVPSVFFLFFCNATASPAKVPAYQVQPTGGVKIPPPQWDLPTGNGQ